MLLNYAENNSFELKNTFFMLPCLIFEISVKIFHHFDLREIFENLVIKPQPMGVLNDLKIATVGFMHRSAVETKQFCLLK